ncbi:MAG TPA: hypothetical protein VGN99_10715 [Steroidobacteraceae bacterium]|nr:hypothetical protein [Steroidobacteraceae bacterium]
MKDPTGPSPESSAAESSRKSWEQSLREHPELESAHEQAGTILQQQFSTLTLRQLRLAYPHVQFRWPAERVEREALEERRWSREVVRRGLFESLNLGANLAIAIFALLWLVRLLSHAPASRTGLFLAAAVVVSLAAYHFARWRAGARMTRQVERFTAWLVATLGIALIWGGVCLAFAYGAFRWFSAPGIYGWSIGGIAGLCGFAYIVMGECSDLEDCLALPGREGVVTLQETRELHQSH